LSWFIWSQVGFGLEELGCLPARRGDLFAEPERGCRILPGQADRLLPQEVRQSGVVDHVLGHEVVGADHPDSALDGLAGESPADHDVGLDVHDIRFHLVEDARGVRLAAPRQHEPQPVVRIPAPRVDPVHRELGAVVLFEEGAVLAARRRSFDEDVVTAFDKPRREARREVRGPIDVRWKGVCADQYAKGCLRC
jgi:hypothetical protein